MLTLGLASPALATTTSGTTTTTVLSQITVTNSTALDFGTIIRGTTLGRVTINATTGARTVTGGVVLAGGTPSRAIFTVSGTPNRVVNIVVTPTTTTIANGTGGTMLVNTFTLNGAANRSLTASGTITVGVGARLNVAANQAPGAYTGTFTIRVDYL